MLRLVVAASLLAVVAGCTDPEPIEPKPKEPKPSASATPTITAPTMPAQARENTPEGVAAFVKHYIDVLNYAANTGDVEELTQVSAVDCSGCQKYIALYRDTYAAGGYFKDGDWKATKFALEPGGTETFVTTTIRSGGGRYRTSTDQPEKASASDTTEVTFAVRGDQTHRQVSQLALGGVE